MHGLNSAAPDVETNVFIGATKHEVALFSGWYVPGAHSVGDVDPSISANVPGIVPLQSEDDFAPGSGENVPTGHRLGTEDPANENFPAGVSRHLSPLSHSSEFLYVPAGHIFCSEFASDLAKYPFETEIQDIDPKSG